MTNGLKLAEINHEAIIADMGMHIKALTELKEELSERKKKDEYLGYDEERYVIELYQIADKQASSENSYEFEKLKNLSWDVFYSAHERYIRKYVRKYEEVAFKAKAIDQSDLYQVCCEAILYGFEKYDLNKNKGRAMTYIQNFIHKRIEKETGTMGYSIAAPKSGREKSVTLNRAVNKYREEYGREPTIEELIDITGHTRTSVLNYKPMYSYLSGIRSLEEFREDGGCDEDDNNRKHLKPLGSPNEPFGDSAEFEKEALYAALAYLPPLHQAILTDSVGMNGKPVLDNKQMAEKYGLYPYAVRRIRNIASEEIAAIISDRKENARFRR